MESDQKVSEKVLEWSLSKKLFEGDDSLVECQILEVEARDPISDACFVCRLMFFTVKYRHMALDSSHEQIRLDPVKTSVSIRCVERQHPPTTPRFGDFPNRKKK
jgi:hypothetical protein